MTKNILRLKQLYYFHIHDIHRDVHWTTVSETFRVSIMRHFFSHEFLAEANIDDVAEERINVVVPLDVDSPIDKALTNDSVGSLTNLLFCGMLNDKFGIVPKERLDDLVFETNGK